MLKVPTESSLPWIKSYLSLVWSGFLRGNSNHLRFAGLALPLTVTPPFFPTARHILQLFPSNLSQRCKPPHLKKKRQRVIVHQPHSKSQIWGVSSVVFGRKTVSHATVFLILYSLKTKIGIRFSGLFEPVRKIFLCLSWKRHFEMSKMNSFIAFKKMANGAAQHTSYI